jgi:hypothetical protein
MAKKKKKKSKTKKSKSVPKSIPKSSGKRSPKASPVRSRSSSPRDEEYMTADEKSDGERDEYESTVSHLCSVTADLDVLERKPSGIPWRLPQKRFRTQNNRKK